MMKLVKILDARSTELVSDQKNQLILKNLVSSEYSITELAGKLKIPTVTVWKRMQKLLAAHLVELSSVKKSANFEKKLYRATAARYLPAELLDFRPKDGHLMKAFDVYSQIQKNAMTLMNQISEIPKEADPVDYALYVTMRAFAQVCGTPDFQRRIDELQERLSEYKPA